MTPDQIKAILPNCKAPDLWAPEFERLQEFGIITPIQLASFFSQVGHESAHFNLLQENLNYSAQGLRRVFGKYFPTEQMAVQYERKPRMIASKVYANRMGNGPEASMDGWKYRGRGLIQITGRNNYRACSLSLYDDERLLDEPDLLLEPPYAMASAGWFWDMAHLNRYAGDVRRTTRLVNGGENGMADRIEIYERARKVLL